MRWIQLHYLFSHIYTGSSSIIKNVQNSAIYKSPSTGSFIYMSERPSRGYIYLSDALNPMALSVWTYEPWLWRYDENVSNIAIFKHPATDSFIYNQNVLLEGRYTYSMRWIQWLCPLGCMGPGCGDMAKNVSHFVIFQSPSTDSFIYNQNILPVGSWTDLMRWIRLCYPFGRTGPGWGDIAENVSHISLLPRKLMKHLNISTSSCANWNLFRRNSSTQ